MIGISKHCNHYLTMTINISKISTVSEVKVTKAFMGKPKAGPIVPIKSIEVEAKKWQ